MPRLAVDYRDYGAETTKLLALHRSTGGIEATFQKLIAEIALLRMFYLLEMTFRAIACKVLCGGVYLDGSSALVLRRCATSAKAVSEMQRYSRERPRDLRWTKTSDIKENLRHLIDPSDHLIRVFDQHGSFIDEVRRVRNRIAHNNPKARADFRVVVRRHYGAELNSVTPGALLLSTRRAPPLMEQYLLKSRILVKELVRGD